MSGSCNREGEKDPRVSRDGEPVPRLQYVTVQDRRIGLVIDWPIQIGRPQLGNGLRLLKHRPEPVVLDWGVTTDERAVDDKTDVIRLYNMI